MAVGVAERGAVERACRGGTETVFSFGNSLDSTQANFDGNYPYGNGKKGPYLEKTAAVKSYAANGYGLYDMHGNVYEWCADWYGETLPGGVDPQGAKTGSFRVFRGGSWVSHGEACRSAFRTGSLRSTGSTTVGFRLAAVPQRRWEQSRREEEGGTPGTQGGDGGTAERLENFLKLSEFPDNTDGLRVFQSAMHPEPGPPTC
ncbi:MAG: formylglycine-generating enzyme family protein [Verrucomicrobiales bacterium]